MFDSDLLALEPAERIRRLDEELAARKSAMSGLFDEWDLYQSFAAGEQWVHPVRNLGLVNYARWAPKARRRCTANFISRYVTNMLGLLTQQTPIMRVQAGSYEADDVRKAEAADQIVYHHRRLKEHRALRRRRVLDMLLFGISWIVVHWDTLWGEVQVDENGETLTDPSGRPVREGRVRMYRLHPRCVFPNLDALDPSDLTDVIIERVLPIPLIRRVWPDAGQYVKKEEGIEDYRRWREASLPGMPRQGSSFKNHARTLEYRVRGDVCGEDYGHIVQWSGRVELYNGTGLFSDGSLGLGCARCDPIKESIFGRPYVSDLIDLQVNINRRLTQIMRFNEKATSGIWWAERGSGAEDVDFRDATTDRVIVGNVGRRPPENLMKQPIPQSVFQELDWLLDMSKMIGTQQAVLVGQSEPAQRSYIQVAYLREQANNTLVATTKEIEDAEAEEDRLILLLAQDRWGEARTVKTLGENQEVLAMEFSKTDIPDEIDIEVVPGSALPKSPSAKFEEQMAALKLPIWDPEMKKADPIMWMQLVDSVGEFGGLRVMTSDIKAAQAKAQRENMLILRGTRSPVHVREFEPHEWHILEHTRCQNSAAYENAGPEVRLQIDLHKAAHDLCMELIAMGVKETLPQILGEYQKNARREQAMQAAMAELQARGLMPQQQMPSPEMPPQEGGMPPEMPQEMPPTEQAMPPPEQGLPPEGAEIGVGEEGVGI